MNKVNAPQLLLEDFNYFLNKAINLYINKKYNIYDVNQQSTDDLRVLKATALLEVKAPWKGAASTSSAAINREVYGAYYEAILPSDYLHMLNCVCLYKVNRQFKCYDKGSIWKQGATRLTSDTATIILNNAYNKPSYRRPYYMVVNVNTSDTNPTYPTEWDGDVDSGNYLRGTDIVSATPDDSLISALGDHENANYRVVSSGVQETTVTGRLPRTINISGKKIDAVEKVDSIRYGNPSTVILQIRYGEDDSLFELKNVAVDYIKAPQNIRLTQEQVDRTMDTSLIMEFPDNVCQQIISELTMIVLENSSDPRLQTHIPVNQSIANPVAQQLAANQ